MTKDLESTLRRYQSQFERSLQANPNVDVRVVLALRTGDRLLPDQPCHPGDGRLTLNSFFDNHEHHTRLNLRPYFQDREYLDAKDWSEHIRDCMDIKLPEPWPDPPSLGVVQGVVFAADTDEGRLAAYEFLQRAQTLEKTAVQYLESIDSSIRPWVSGAAGWISLLCQMALTYRHSCPYRLMRSHETDAGLGGPPGEFDRVVKFLESWSLADWPPPGNYLISPWDDARSASIEAINLMLSRTKPEPIGREPTPDELIDKDAFDRYVAVPPRKRALILKEWCKEWGETVGQGMFLRRADRHSMRVHGRPAERRKPKKTNKPS